MNNVHYVLCLFFDISFFAKMNYADFWTSDFLEHLVKN